MGKILGVQGGAQTAQTRLEWTCLQEDMNDALRGKEPEFQGVKFEHVQEEIGRANQDENKTQIIIASCPCQIGNDDQIMQRVKAMVRSSRAAHQCFSYDNVLSALEFSGVASIHAQLGAAAAAAEGEQALGSRGSVANPQATALRSVETQKAGQRSVPLFPCGTPQVRIRTS